MNTSSDSEINQMESSIDNIEQEIEESASCEFEDLHSFAVGEVADRNKSGLLAKLNVDPSFCFPISDYSSFKDDAWTLLKEKTGSAKRILFNSTLPDSNFLKKCITYYLIPDFHPFGRIRSYISTGTYAYAHKYLEDYVFKDNGITASPESINTITTKMINDALDKSRDYGGHRHYTFLYFYIIFWLSLSHQKLIPTEYSLDISIRRIDTKDRQKDVVNKVSEERVGWSPFSEEDLAKLVEHAFFWIESALPKLIDVKNYLKKIGQFDSNAGLVISSKPMMELEETLGVKIGGVKICGFEKNISTSAKHILKSGEEVVYPRIDYRWKRKYKNAVDKVRDGILILISLITGMRNRELGMLKFDDIYQDESGHWHINITRFKTSTDPNYFGEAEEIPLPTFLGEIISSYKEIRDAPDCMRDGVVLQQVSNSRDTVIHDRAVQRAARDIGYEIGVDSVHPHRFRKTIAEILINRSEQNIDIIRLLFGHKSYVMTLRYIARNPYLVNSMVEAMEIHYAAEFMDIVAAVRSGKYSGQAAESIAKKTLSRPELFTGKMLRLTVLQYVSYLLESGEPLFIQRTTLGTYCVSCNKYSSSNPPPCVDSNASYNEIISPDTTNCKLDCKNAVVLENAKDSLQENNQFYEKLLVEQSGNLTKVAVKQLKGKIKINEEHLANLEVRRCIGKSFAEEIGL